VSRICLSLSPLLSLFKTSSFHVSLLLPTDVDVLLPPQGNNFSGARAGQPCCCPRVPLSKKQIMPYILHVFSSTVFKCVGAHLHSFVTFSQLLGSTLLLLLLPLTVPLISFLFKGSPAPNTLSWLTTAPNLLAT